jgi:hypothetical protein
MILEDAARKLIETINRLEKYTDAFLILANLYAITPLIVSGIGICKLKLYSIILVLISIPFILSYIPKRLKLSSVDVSLFPIYLLLLVILEIIFPLLGGFAFALEFYKDGLTNNGLAKFLFIQYISEYITYLFMFAYTCWSFSSLRIHPKIRESKRQFFGRYLISFFIIIIIMYLIYKVMNTYEAICLAKLNPKTQ